MSTSKLIFSGNLELVKTLFEEGVDVNATSFLEMTPLHVAAENGELLTFFND